MSQLTPEQKDQISELAISMYEKDPKSFKKAAKQIHPDLSIPEVEQEIALEQTRTQTAEEIEALRQEVAKQSQKMNLVLKRTDLEKKGYTKDDVKEMEELILNKKVNDYDGAEALLTAQRRLAEPTGGTIPSTRVESGFTPEKLEEISRPGWAREEAMRAINDLRSGKVKLGDKPHAIPRLA